MNFKTLTFLSAAILFYACNMPAPKDLLKESIIPLPASIEATNSAFILNKGVGIYYSDADEPLKFAGEQLAQIIESTTGYNVKVQSESNTPSKGNIFLHLSAELEDLGDEGYLLDITEDMMVLSAFTAEGVFRGVQTLRQILPVKIDSSSKDKFPWTIATGVIKDKPVYGYRGSMLDVARHFFSVKDVKRYIDLMAVYKLNALHLGLSNDQGWRIEIKSWPKLATHGGSTEVGGGEGGYYTQEEYTDIVNYAKDRYITIIPEIDMPGHTNAALASYAELNCDGKARELYTGIEVGFSTLCTDKEITYKFIDDVIGELAALTPGPYIHIGGDESHVTPMEDYIPFVNRVQEIVTKHGKKVIGWDEIANATLVENSVVQYWAEAANAKKGIEQNAKVLMSPAVKTYLDMQYDSTTELGLHWAAYIEVDEAYNWDPAEMEEGIDREHIIGVESPLWTETITNMEEIEYMVFPRIICHAEIGWTETSKRDWEEFKVRLGKQCPKLEALDINYYPSKVVPWN